MCRRWCSKPVYENCPRTIIPSLLTKWKTVHPYPWSCLYKKGWKDEALNMSYPCPKMKHVTLESSPGNILRTTLIPVPENHVIASEAWDKYEPEYELFSTSFLIKIVNCYLQRLPGNTFLKIVPYLRSEEGDGVRKVSQNMLYYNPAKFFKKY